MESTDSQCKHNRIQRNCYLCHMEFESNKTQLDTIYETISELKIRIEKLEVHRRLQIDENRGIANHFDEIEKIMKRWEVLQTAQNERFNKRISHLESMIHASVSFKAFNPVQAVADRLKAIDKELEDIKKHTVAWND